MNELLNRIQQGTALPEDYRALRELIDADTTGETIALVHAFHSEKAAAQPYDKDYWDKVVHGILQIDKQGRREMEGAVSGLEPVTALAPVRPVASRRAAWMAAAAMLVVAIGIYLFTRPAKTPSPPVVVKEKVPILPGKNGAVLTLSDGNTIVLDSLPDGVIAMQGNVKVQLHGGQLQYGKADQKASKETVAWNTLRTPRGSQYQVVLPDGTKVWLNAASSLRFPTAFTGTGREIEITGEAYLEVAALRLRSGKKMPFNVKVGGNTIEVLGTHFNINAYEDEGNITTTLLEGKVVVKSEVGSRKSDRSVPTSDFRPQTSVVLKPGQQAVLTHDARLTIQDNVDVDQVVAWKNGFFHFDGAALQVVMRQLSRWYDVEVKYEGHPDTGMTFNGKMGRDLKLAQVLKILQKSEVHFTIRDRAIVVMP
jgi:transmembrane sensor